MIPSNQPIYHWWNGNNYHLHSNPQFDLGLEILEKFPFKGDEKVLDIGCGDGKITTYIAREKVLFGTVVGIDASNSMIEYAMQHNKQCNVAFYDGLAESFHLDENFDLIVSFSALHWVSDQRAVWGNICRHLKIGGYALISLNPLPRNRDLTDSMEEVIQSEEFSTYFRECTEKRLMPLMSLEEYKKIVVESGLSVDECGQSTKTFDFEDKSAFINNLTGWLPHIPFVPEEHRYQFVETIVRKFLVKTDQDTTKKVKLSYNHFLIRATRLK